MSRIALSSYAAPWKLGPKYAPAAAPRPVRLTSAIPGPRGGATPMTLTLAQTAPVATPSTATATGAVEGEESAEGGAAAPMDADGACVC